MKEDWDSLEKKPAPPKQNNQYPIQNSYQQSNLAKPLVQTTTQKIDLDDDWDREAGYDQPTPLSKNINSGNSTKCKFMLGPLIKVATESNFTNFTVPEKKPQNNAPVYKRPVKSIHQGSPTKKNDDILDNWDD